MLLIACAVRGTPACAADKIMPDLFFKITQKIVTPHIQWGPALLPGETAGPGLRPARCRSVKPWN